MNFFKLTLRPNRGRNEAVLRPYLRSQNPFDIDLSSLFKESNHGYESRIDIEIVLPVAKKS